jgi:dihydroorotase
MNPPLRAAADRDAMLAGLIDGTIDAIATDHAPHALYEKEVEFDKAAYGITGLEIAMAAAVTALYSTHKVPLSRLVELLSTNPARIVQLGGRGTLAAGSIADVTIFDPKKRWTYDLSKTRSRSRNCPYNGMQFHGKVKATIVGGKIVFNEL